MSDPVTAAFVITAIVGTGVSVQQSRQAAAASRRANAARRRAERLRASRQRQTQLREARIRRAQIANQEAVSGATTSAAAGATSAIQSQVASNVSFLNALDTLGESAFQAQQAGSRAASRAATGAAVAQVGLQGLDRASSLTN